MNHDDWLFNGGDVAQELKRQSQCNRKRRFKLNPSPPGEGQGLNRASLP